MGLYVSVGLYSIRIPRIYCYLFFECVDGKKPKSFFNGCTLSLNKSVTNRSKMYVN